MVLVHGIFSFSVGETVFKRVCVVGPVVVAGKPLNAVVLYPY